MIEFFQALEPLEIGLIVTSALGFAVYLAMLHRPTSLMRTVAKTLAVAALAGLTLAMGGPKLLALALILSALGDAFLAHDGDVAFLGGLGSFLAAHIAYAVLFLSSGPGLAAAPLAGLLAVAVFALVMGFVMVRKAGPLALPVAAYVLAIAVMGLGGVTLGGLVLAGVVLFMASDAILGSEKFLMPEASRLRRLTSPAVWILYYAGQALITLGLLA
ncbi:putative membrane protein [Hoeflea sp. IMCC20628]|uniref:lysoplasmalogenase n=1 Tax=Hoeflea sp. IMCC20628 TaxID=1620421 RepID=UPI00063AC403|nr:lysoplasmalogenase [Hoeflea sp. IMCC20628]AKI03222.1 putative membrane protein [Hoeflea sp. IMCC20628]